MDKKRKKISIIIPTKDRPIQLILLLKTFLQQAKGEELDFEIILVDDGSAEKNLKMIQDFIISFPQIKLFINPGKGPSQARNKGASMSEGDWLLFLDDDVILHPEFVRSLKIFLKDDYPHAYAGRIILLDRWRYGPLTVGPLNERGEAGLTANFLCKKETFERAGGFDPSFSIPAYEDLDLNFRLENFTEIRFAPLLTVFHPPRKLDVKRLMFEGREWEYVYITGKRYKRIGLKRRKTNFPLLSVFYYAIIALPGGRFLNSMRWLKVNFFHGVKGMFISILNSIINVFFSFLLFLKVLIRKL